MEEILLLLFFIIVGYMIMTSMKDENKVILTDEPSHTKPQHVLHNVLQDFSSGDKISLIGDCNVNLYTKDTIPTDMKERFTILINKILESIYGLTNQIYDVQEINNIYEQIDVDKNGRYILDATILSKNNYYTVNIVVDVVLLQGEIMINSVNTNQSSNNNLLNRYDIVFNDQGILLDKDNFKTNMLSLLDNKYKQSNKLIGVDMSRLDDKNYPLDNVLSLTSLLNRYYPASASIGTIDNLKEKGIDGLIEQYFPKELITVESPQYCNLDEGKDSKGCIFNHNSTSSEYTQPFMAPGLFFDRSSYPL